MYTHRFRVSWRRGWVDRTRLCNHVGALFFAAGLAIALPAISFALGQPPADEPEKISFVVFFHNDGLAGDPSDCTAVFPVRREVPRTDAVGSAALRSLFRGPTAEERAEGYRSFFSQETATLLKKLRIANGAAYVDLADPRALLPNATSSCGAAEFQSQIAATLKQFPSVDRVLYAIEGDARAFYVWMGEACNGTNDNCNSRPFQ